MLYNPTCSHQLKYKLLKYEVFKLLSTTQKRVWVYEYGETSIKNLLTKEAERELTNKKFEINLEKDIARSTVHARSLFQIFQCQPKDQNTKKA